MAKKDDEIKVVITGDSTGLSKSLQEAENKINQFGKKTGGTLGGVASNTSQVFGTLSKGILGVAGVAVTAGTAVAALTLKVNGLVSELNQLSTRSGISITQLQKLQKAFRATGIDAEGLADISQDTSDKMGEGYAAGTGEFVTVIEEMGLNINDFTKYVGKANGGIEAMISLYYKLREAGKTQAEITYAMEAVASNGSRLATVLSDYSTETEALQHIQEQQTTITEDQAKAFKKFDDNLDKLSTTGQNYLVNVLSPIVESTNEFIDAMSDDSKTKDFWTRQTDRALTFSKVLRSMGFGFGLGDDAIAIIDKAKADQKKNEQPVLNNTLPLTPATANDDEWKQKKKAQEAADKAKKAADAAAKAAAAARKKAADEQIAAQKALDKILVDQTTGTNERQLAEFERQQKEIVETIKKSAKTLGLSDEKLRQLLNDQVTAGAASRLKMINDMLGYSDPNQSINDQNALLASGQVGAAGQAFIGNQLDQQLGLDTTSYDMEAMNKERDALLKQNELLIQDKESFEKRKAAITAKYAQRAVEIQHQETMQLLEGTESAFAEIGNGMAAAFDGSSGAAQAAFAVQKGITISMTIMKIQEALAGALALGFPQNIPAYAQIAAMGMSIISTAKGASAGQFHGGVDELDSSLDNKSFVLKAGERVVQPEANKKLTNFLDNQEKGGGTMGGDTIINAPLYVYGSDDDKQFQEKLKKHQNSIVQAVRDSQKRNS
ncbi:hypothetical protein K6631_06815 [Escherichia coli]|uniref:hypothetical protein n=1 Tax=Escherichia coli TaxID=562 RepID=UPI001C9A2EB3|nr:hypothetical protein [Escherichia coli]MBY7334193.1 hypothetical protein [Escherichia coli]MBY7475372.1 hypothetical protein [Escherichia coli]MDN2007578.1 hypothetical protein [Escherichia coli]